MAMISIDNTKSPFIKSRKLRPKGDTFRGGGVKDYTVPSTGTSISRVRAAATPA